MLSSSFCGRIFSFDIICETFPDNDRDCNAIWMHWARRSKLSCNFTSKSRSPNFSISVALNLTAKMTAPSATELIDGGDKSLTDFDSCMRLFRMAKCSLLYAGPSVEPFAIGESVHHLISPGNGLTIGIEIAPCGRTNCGNVRVHNVG